MPENVRIFYNFAILTLLHSVDLLLRVPLTGQKIMTNQQVTGHTMEW